MISKPATQVPLADSFWEGVFDSFAEAKGDPETFDGDNWAESLTRKFEARRSGLDAGREVPSLAVAADNPLPLLAGIVAATSPLPLNILDFGGGVGLTYLEARAALAPRISLDWHVIERPSVCKLGRRLCKSLPEVRFHESIGAFRALGVPPSIVHVGSALHYVEDWRSCAANLVSSGPPYLSLMDVPAGDVSTFVTLQRYYSKRIPVWFWNMKEFEGTIGELGYRLVHRVKCRTKIVENEGALPMMALPADRRLAYTCNMLFAKQTPTDLP